MKPLALHRLTLCIAGLLALEALAQTPPPVAPLEASKVRRSVDRPPAQALHMGGFTVRLEHTTLDEVRRSAAAGAIAHQGDAGESVYWLCYTSAGVERIWFTADGEMGGPEHRITGISAQRLPNGAASSDCPALPAALLPLALDRGLWLGAADSALTARFGPAAASASPWRVYEYLGKVPGRCAGSFDLAGWLVLHVQDGTVDMLEAGQITSC